MFLVKLVSVWRNLQDYILTLLQVTYAFVFVKRSCLVKDPGDRSGRVCILTTGTTSEDETISALMSGECSLHFMCVNSYVLQEKYTYFRPRYYSICDPIFFLDAHGSDQNLRLDVAARIRDDTVWPLKLFVPDYAAGSQFIELVSTNANIELVYLGLAPLSSYNRLSFWCFSRGRGVPVCSNVAVYAVSIALWLGCVEIYLANTSFDFFKDFQVDEANRVVKNSSGALVPHYHSSRSKGLYTPTIAEALENIVVAFKSFEFLSKAADRMGCRIINLDKASMIDAFSKKL